MVLNIPCFSWTSFHSLGQGQVLAKFNFLYRFDTHGGFWSTARVGYGISEKADIFAELGYVRSVEMKSGGLGYGCGVKWEFLSKNEIIPGMAFLVDYRATRESQNFFNWVDLILETSFAAGYGWEYYLVAGLTMPKGDEPSSFLGAGFIAPLAGTESGSLFLGLRYNTRTANDESYFSLETGINYFFE